LADSQIAIAGAVSFAVADEELAIHVSQRHYPRCVLLLLHRLFFSLVFVDVRRTPSTFQPTHMPCWPSAASCSGGYVLALRLMVAEKMSSPPTIESVTISTLFLEDT
jgi:hypothetical protein